MGAERNSGLILGLIAAPNNKAPSCKAKSSQQLAQDYHNKLDCANRKQQEAGEAKAVADAALGELVAGGQAIGLAVSPITAKQAPKIVKEGW